MMRTNAFLKDFPPDTHSWAGKVTFSLGYPHAGWIILAVHCTAYVQTVYVDCSYVGDPFPKFIAWLEGIADGRLPCEFSIDEEGYGKTFRAAPVNNEEFLFTVTPMYWRPQDGETEEPIFLYVIASKKQFISEFLKRWDDFIANQWDAKEWGSNDLPGLDVSRLRKFVEG